MKKSLGSDRGGGKSLRPLDRANSRSRKRPIVSSPKFSKEGGRRSKKTESFHLDAPHTSPQRMWRFSRTIARDGPEDRGEKKRNHQRRTPRTTTGGGGAKKGQETKNLSFNPIRVVTIRIGGEPTHVSLGDLGEYATEWGGNV